MKVTTCPPNTVTATGAAPSPCFSIYFMVDKALGRGAAGPEYNHCSKVFRANAAQLRALVSQRGVKFTFFPFEPNPPIFSGCCSDNMSAQRLTDFQRIDVLLFPSQEY